MLIRKHEATDRNEDKKPPREIKAIYNTLVWRKEHFPGWYPEMNFTLEYWQENWRDIWYFHIPDIVFHDGNQAWTEERRKKGKKANKIQPYKFDARHKNPVGRPPMLLIANGIEYPSCKLAAAHYELQEQSVRNRCQSTIEKWVDWYWIKKAPDDRG